MKNVHTSSTTTLITLSVVVASAGTSTSQLLQPSFNSNPTNSSTLSSSWNHYNESSSSLLQPSPSSSVTTACWKCLDASELEELKARGWNEHAWNVQDATLMDFYNEAELRWDQLPDDRLQFWKELGYDEQLWLEDRDEFHDSPTIMSDSNIQPVVLKVSIPELEQYNFSYYKKLGEEVGIEVGVSAGKDEVCDEHNHLQMNLTDYITSIEQGLSNYKLSIEETDEEKEEFEIVGETVQRYVHETLKQHSHFTNTASIRGNKDEAVDDVFDKEWHDVKDPTTFFSWSVWMGSKGTRTPMHYDSDRFNFLYVVEGRKRVVIVPNDESTKGFFPIQQFFSGSAYTGMNILSQNYTLPEGSVDVTIGPGEGIVIPYRMWHAIENVESNVAYGFRVVD